ncbi:hypothetical protein FB562_0480 [Homoserinimonas aerilata]|uniref:Uncharacterized protein n=2 Tax=Homoserinimonas aerilata TaxID=1162970 RepID=A0A542YHE3_9MICO|nr:hypothetical protein FB562_0480 [Homoserinimonas aerilata]
MRYAAALLLLLVTLVATLATHHAQDGVEVASVSPTDAVSVMDDTVSFSADISRADAATGLVGFEAATTIDILVGVCAAILVCCMIALLAFRLRMRIGRSLGLSERLMLPRLDAAGTLRMSATPSLIVLSISRI